MECIDYINLKRYLKAIFNMIDATKVIIIFWFHLEILPPESRKSTKYVKRTSKKLNSSTIKGKSATCRILCVAQSSPRGFIQMSVRETIELE